jgi:uncharacterized protein YndB with AHSA1/START domain
MFKTITLGLLAVVGAILVFAATRPGQFNVRRSITIQAPPERIFPLINDFHAWSRWSPWEKLDPALQRTYGGPPAGPGASYAWKGNAKVGEGRMEIRSATAPTQISIQLDFIKPFEGHNITDFTLQPQGGGTLVEWHMHGPTPFISKLMGLFVDMDKMIGKDFERGLAQMKAAAQASAAS